MLSLTAIPELQQRIALYEDMKAYEELYHLLSIPLQKFSFSIVKSREAAEEIVSDVFIKLWQIRSKLNEVENLKIYLYTITKNFSINYLHKNYKNVSYSINEIDIEPLISIGNPEEIFISTEMVNRIRKEILNLPPQCRLIFQLVKEDGLKYKEAADVLNLSVLTVRNQLAIAVKKIAALLPTFNNTREKITGKFSDS